MCNYLCISGENRTGTLHKARQENEDYSCEFSNIYEDMFMNQQLHFYFDDFNKC